MSSCTENFSFLEKISSDGLQEIDLSCWRVCLQPGWKFHGRTIFVYKRPCSELSTEAKEELAAAVAKLSAVYQALFQTPQYSYKVHADRHALAISVSPKPSQGAAVCKGQEPSTEVWKIYRDVILTAWMMAAVRARL